MSDSDRSLVSRIREGDELAATELYQRYFSRVERLVHAKTSEHLRAQVDTDDLVQSIFKSVFHGVDARGYQASQDGSLWQLIVVIALHKVRKNASKRAAQKRDSRRTQSLSALETGSDMGTESTAEMEVALRESIAALEPFEREVVTLRVQGYSVEEIAARLKKSQRTIERRLRNARASLASMLEFDHEP